MFDDYVLRQLSKALDSHEAARREELDEWDYADYGTPVHDSELV
jgi:hypothetical protein